MLPDAQGGGPGRSSTRPASPFRTSRSGWPCSKLTATAAYEAAQSICSVRAVARYSLVLALLAVALLAAACGSDKKSGAAQLTPSGAIFYGQATLDPEGGQKKSLERLIAKFPGSGPPGQRVQDLLERALREDRKSTRLNSSHV